MNDPDYKLPTVDLPSGWLGKAVGLATLNVYFEHGFEVHNTHHYMPTGKSQVTLERLAEALKRPELQKAARDWIATMQQRINDLNALLPTETT